MRLTGNWTCYSAVLVVIVCTLESAQVPLTQEQIDFIFDI